MNDKYGAASVYGPFQLLLIDHLVIGMMPFATVEIQTLTQKLLLLLLSSLSEMFIKLSTKVSSTKLSSTSFPSI